MISIAGRSLKSGRVTIFPAGDGLTIRIDDEERPEWWLEIVLTPERLQALLKLCEAAQLGGLELPEAPDTIQLPPEPWVV